MYSYLVRKQVVACLLFGDFSVVKAGSGSGVLVQIDIRDNIWFVLAYLNLDRWFGDLGIN